MGTSPASARSRSKSPTPANNKPSRQDLPPDVKTASVGKLEGSSNAEVAKPLAPPLRPQSQQAPGGSQTPDFFAPQVGGSLSLEPNPFEQSFGGGGPETPGGTKLPPVAALTSPSSLLPGSNATPFNWGGGSLRTGPLSPAMLSGPANDYFSDTHHLRGGFPTPNESSLRSGLTPGGSGSMFPAPSPNSQALFAQLASGGATPNTLDFHRTALSAAVKREQGAANAQQPPQAPTSSAPQQEAPNGPSTEKTEAKPATGPFDPHDNDAANGLFMLAQGGQARNRTQNTAHFPPAAAPAPAPTAAPAVAPPVSGPGHAHPAPASTLNHEVTSQVASHPAQVNSVRAASDNSNVSEDGMHMKPTSRTKGKKNSLGSNSNGRRKADDVPTKVPAAKKAKVNNGHSNGMLDMSDEDDEDEDEDDMRGKFEDGGGAKSKMTEEEKRKNFLERNRVAALKCRQRKKQWLANLQNKVEMYGTENDALTTQVTQLREEVVNLKTLLLAHKDCPVTQQQGIHSAFIAQMEPYNAQMNPYGMAGPIPNQQVMPGQNVQRRFS
ncbi:hypothetical protein L249_8836 [Ophiocordyceps polyrhachis-furcata BCC 54312]|uniref:BZIP domain-containing protein n=1 Tax=Ophiocordyceps polyrhachis-furcata BCC 54312 TaxID=1330021 RepID=A0A367L227_9HYPO|nr:hypothetical protein L249_8836 [Ophiocordyceps polyrhachis-furcata BCC 54312]